MARMTPEQVARKWATNYSNSGNAMEEAIKAITENPMEKAAAKVEKYQQGIMRAIQSGKWVAGLKRMSLAQWKERTIKLTRARMVDGAAKGEGSMRKFMDAWLPYMDALRVKLNTMASDTLEQRKQRMIAAFEWNSKFRRDGGTGGQSFGGMSFEP